MKRFFCGTGCELKGAGWRFWVGTPIQAEKSRFLILFHQKRVKAPPPPPAFASPAVAGVECLCAAACSCFTGTWEPGLDDWEELPSLHFTGTQTDLELLIPMLGWQVYAMTPPFSSAEGWTQGCLNASSVTSPAWVLRVGCLDVCSLGQFSLEVIKYTLSKNSSLTSKYALPSSLVYSFPLGSSSDIPTHNSQHCLYKRC